MKRIISFFKKSPIVVVAFFGVLMIRILKPFYIIRFGVIDIGRIGGSYSGNMYLSAKAQGKYKSNFLDFFYFIKHTNHSNTQWERMWHRVLPVFPFTTLAIYLERVNKIFPGFQIHKIPEIDIVPTLDEYRKNIKDDLSKLYNDKIDSIIKTKKPNLYFTPEEESYAEKEMLKFGLSADDSFICFHARDSSYLKQVVGSYNFSYHDFRDSNIDNYIQAVEGMINRGYRAFRMGAIAEKPLKEKNIKLIDYAFNKNKSDFLDIYLISKSKFFICSDTGLSFPAEVFKVPIVFVNWAVILRLPVYAHNCLIIFKKFFSRTKKRFLSFSEMMDLDLFTGKANEELSNQNLEVIENTPDEIFSLAVEMDERLSGKWTVKEDDKILQEKFWSIFGPGQILNTDIRVGTKFLRDNRFLLESIKD